MIIFHPRQTDCARGACKNEKSVTFNFTSRIASSICTVAFTKCEKFGTTIFTSRRSRLSLVCIFRQGHALPLVPTRFLRLAYSSPKLARSPARRSRDGREPSGKKSGEMSRIISAQWPGNGRTMATAMSPVGRRDDSQDNLPCARFGRAMAASETSETTRNLAAQQLASSSWEFRRQLLTMISKNYEHTNHTNSRS
jgi:hypothetical protein